MDASSDFGERSLSDRWADMLPTDYRAAANAAEMAVDVTELHRLATGPESFAVRILPDVGARGCRGPAPASAPSETSVDTVLVAVYQLGERAELSRLMPMLESLGLWVQDETSWELDGDAHAFVYHIRARAPARAGGGGAGWERAAECLRAIWRKDAEVDRLNELVLTAPLHWEQVQVLRAYRVYRQQAGWRYALERDHSAFLHHPGLAAALAEYFKARFEPTKENALHRTETAIEQDIADGLTQVASLEEDVVIRDQLSLVRATSRTNAYRAERTALALKIETRRVPQLGGTQPLTETFVFSPGMEGVHVRATRIARGGVRISTRSDYRREAVELMRAQMAKNALIAPGGAKGIIVIKPAAGDRSLPAVVREQYAAYVGALLDVTDDMQGARAVRPRGIRAHDDDDTYLVVAADKGTARLSDLANELASARGYWLGDAFASGGATGFSHRQLGITARGAWESLRRHFRDLGVDADRDPITVAGVGDMSGDVFGNALLLGPNLRLIAAYDGRHIFVDPNPDPELALAERRRLFQTPDSTWGDYRRRAISPGGGVWRRDAKQISLSAPARDALGVPVDTLTPDALISCVLRSPVDLLYNGGIGTFVRASDESDGAVEDRTADAFRVAAADLRCKVVVEGGNLGLTQAARVEFAAAGGLVNADFIDNAGGVTCSDREVNCKLLLNQAARAHRLDPSRRRAVLGAAAPDVVQDVLRTVRDQARVLSLEARRSPGLLDVYGALIDELEAVTGASRATQVLPSADTLARRARHGTGMLEPELAVLLSYAKHRLKAAALKSTLAGDAYLAQRLPSLFPSSVVEGREQFARCHPLKRELLAASIANEVVATSGIVAAFRLGIELDIPLADVLFGFVAAHEISGIRAHVDAVDALRGRLTNEVELRLWAAAGDAIEKLARFYARRRSSWSLGDVVERDRAGFALLRGRRLDGHSTSDVDDDSTLVQDDSTPAEDDSTPVDSTPAEDDSTPAEAVPGDVVRLHGALAELADAPRILAVSRTTGRDPVDCAEVFRFLRSRLPASHPVGSERSERPPNELATRAAAAMLEDDFAAIVASAATRALSGAPGVPPLAAAQAFVEGVGGGPDAGASPRVGSIERGSGLAGTVLELAHLREHLGA